MSGDNGLSGFILQLMLLSLLAIGGVNTILPDIHRIVVVDHGWMTSDQFAALYALAQAAPGPNMMFITLIGWQVAGLVGALSATAAICGPASIIAYWGARLSTQWQHLKWFKLVRNGLVPVTTGLMVASAWLLIASTGHSPMSYGVTAATVVVVLATRLNPLWLLALGGALGAAGLI